MFLVVDSWGKIPAGIMMGNIFAFGNFDECVNFKRELSAPIQTMEGQYCMAFLKVSKGNSRFFSSHEPNILTSNNTHFNGEFEIEDRAGSSLFIGSGICIPKSCDSHSMNQYLRDTSISITACQTNDRVELKPIDYVTM